MEGFGAKLKTLRMKHGLLLRQVAAAAEVDTSMVSKFEKGDRFPTRKQIEKLASIFQASEKELLIHAFSDRLVAYLSNEPLAKDIIEQTLKRLKTEK